MNEKPPVRNTEIIDEMKTSYLNYAMSVIVSRALPDIRDGLKPVQRRILYAMYKMRLFHNAKYSKSAKVVGEVLGKYHPHGDAPVYEALVRMAQDFSMRYPLIKGQGNFGSIDGDPPAAMRYTEVKLTKIAEELLSDIEKDTVDFIDNFDGTLQEPLYLPAKIPNLLMMGAEGIAVGMATKIPPHNLTEVISAINYCIDKAKLAEISQNSKDPKTAELEFPVSLDELMQFIKGPDFPTAGIIYGIDEIKNAYTSGKGKILIRGKVEHEETRNKERIVIKELPYQVNKANLVAKIADLVTNKKIEGISDLRDESDREGIRIVIELKRGTPYKKILNALYKYTELQTTFPVNFVCLVNGIPQTISLKTALEEYIRHRVNIIVRRSEYELKQAEARAHILEGLLKALDHIDEIITIIRRSENESEAKQKLIDRFKFTPVQAQAILDMQLKKLTGLERHKLEEELKQLRELISYLKTLLSDVFKILQVIKNELLEIAKTYKDNRKTEIVAHRPEEITDEKLIPNKEVFVMLTKAGYIKKLTAESFKAQKRGGVGTIGIEVKDEDQVQQLIFTQEHNYILFFTNQGKVFKLRAWEIPESSKRSKGKAIVNFLNLSKDDSVVSIIDLDNNHENFESLFFVTESGIVKRTKLKDFKNIRSNGIIAIRLEPTDRLKWVIKTKPTDDIMIFSKNGKAIVFPIAEARPMGRSAKGVKGINLDKNNKVVAADRFSQEEKNNYLIIVSENGIGKKTKLSEFKEQHRGGVGIKAIGIDKKTGDTAFAGIIRDEKQLVISTEKGQIIKINLDEIPIRSRAAKGVKLIKSKNNGKVSTATLI
ncbi:MAG: DNA gyrase subunit A [Patescibacteria group bacterium]|nr:MAG: DNA gyrase subunit A [Patescibacteria group bacterium]